MRASLYAAGFLLLTTPAVAQVHVAVSTDKAEYVEGEPIVVVLDVHNEGTTAIGYPSDVSVSVSGAGQRIPPNLFGCSGLRMGEGSGWGRSSHEPTLKPGETQTFKYVVRGYDLAPACTNCRSPAPPALVEAAAPPGLNRRLQHQRAASRTPSIGFIGSW